MSAESGQGGTMKNPLNRRIVREIRGDFGKYLVIFFLLLLSIAEISGFLVADGSMIRAYQESFEKYCIEDGHFTVADKMNSYQIRQAEALGTTIYENFYIDQGMENGSVLRMFLPRSQVNLVCLMEGKMPESDGQIAIDRMYADNNGLQAGDVIKAEDGQTWTVTGLVALSDYSSLFENNCDTIFDAVKFGVAILPEEAFSSLTDEPVLQYSWIWNNPPADEKAEKDQAETFCTGLNALTDLREYVPQYQNQAITFTGEDMGSDKAMIMLFLYIVIVIIAFVFAVTISDTIEREAGVIGTLLASGYTRRELVRHYMMCPVLVTLAAALAGNLFGYTVMKELNAAMYYSSYSLPSYVTIWSTEAFVKTTLIPVFLMAVIDYTVLAVKLSLSPLKFLRHDLKRRRQGRAVPLPSRMKIFHRFRIRVILQNIPGYFVLLAGILFADTLLMFGMMMPLMFAHYGETMKDQLLANYQYILEVPAALGGSEVHADTLLKTAVDLLQFNSGIRTENPDAEKFSIYSMKTLTAEDWKKTVAEDPEDAKTVSRGVADRQEDVLLYGIQDGSRYVDLNLKENDVYLSAAYAEKYEMEPGDAVILKEPYTDKTYSFTITGVYSYEGAVALFLPQKSLNRILGFEDDYFSGYFSESRITDIDSRYIGQTIDLDALTKVSRQMEVSMGGLMNIVDAFAVLLFLILVYLLSKIIIEKNARSISLAKVLGFTDRDICRLYILPTSQVVAAALLAALPVVRTVLVRLYRTMICQEISGWIPVYLDSALYIKMYLLGIASYLFVTLLEYRKIQIIPMDAVLKDLE